MVQVGVRLFVTEKGVRQFKVITTSKNELKKSVFWVRLLQKHLSDFEDELQEARK